MNDKYSIYHGDCLEIMPTLGEVDAVVTDPPYKMTAGGLTESGLNKSMSKLWNYDNKGSLFDVPDFSDWMSFLYDCCNDDVDFYTMTNDKNLIDMTNCAKDAKWKFHNVIV